MRTFLLLLSWVPLIAEEAEEQRRAQFPRIYALSELARSAPSEFAAGGLLRLLDAGAIPTREWKISVANEVLILAKTARHPHPRRAAPGIVAVDSRTALWTSGYAERLDTLSLSLRAIDHLRKWDRAAAGKAFAQLPRPQPAPSACKDAMVDDLSAWYETAAGLDADPLPIIQSIQSPGEIGPAIDLLFHSRNTPETLALYAGAIGQRLSSLRTSEREFNAALFDAPGKVQHLYSVLVARNLSTGALAEGWRAWMQAGLEAPACEESRKPGSLQQARQKALDLLNQTLASPLPADLLKPAGTGEAADTGIFAQSDGTRRQTELLRKLMFGNGSRGLSPAEKDTPEWRETMQDYIQAIEGRTRTADESDIEYFYRQSQLWSGVLMASPAGPVRDRALQQYISFLLINAPHIEPIVWYSQLRTMTELGRGLHGGEFTKLLQALHATGHPVLRLYAELEMAYPTRPTARPN
ncbi:MAG: hypothetical protein HYX27_10625 [Acidobacteria bacterium]|nr:hypothetical protein [Acidobacteriota bacterium]